MAAQAEIFEFFVLGVAGFGEALHFLALLRMWLRVGRLLRGRFSRPDARRP
jgi:hypothetical protein